MNRLSRRGVPASVLYSSAASPGDLMKARSADADLYLIDLEDSVPPQARAEARRRTALFLQSAPAPSRTAVRINPLSSLDYCLDLAMLTACAQRPAYLFMTMVDAPAEIICLRRALAAEGWQPEIYVTIETPRAVGLAAAIAAEADGMILGSADLAASLGVGISAPALLAARQAMVLAAAAAEVGCLDTGNFALADAGALRAEITEARSLGFHGKGCVHPKELAAINAAFRPDEAELAEAKRVVAAYDAARGGVCMLDGRMIGPPFARAAKGRLARAEAWQRSFGAGS